LNSIAQPDRPLRRHPQVLLIVGVGALTSTVRWLELLAVGVFVFDRTGSALLVALMTMLRMLPMALFGALAGALAERMRRVPAVRVALGLLAALAWLLAALADAGRLEVWHLALAAFTTGAFWAMDNPFRRTLVSDIVAPSRLAGAMSLDVVANNGSRMLGPLLGGALLQTVGIAGAFVLSGMLYLVCLGLMFVLRHRDEVRPGHPGVLASLVDGARYLAGHRTLTGILVVTVIFNVFGFPFLSMVPVIGREQLGLSAWAIGVVASLEGVGVLAGALATMLWLRERHYRRVYFFGVVVYELGALVFGQASWVGLSAAGLLLAGLAGAVYSAMQSTLVMLCAEPAARTRMMGVLSVCIGTGPVGFLHLGWMAEQVGAPAAVTIMGIEGLAALWITARVWPELLAPQPAG